MLKRAFDMVVATLALLLLSPLLLAISLSILLTSRGGVLFRQERVGKDEKIFRLLKFRTMRPGSEVQGQLTLGQKDPRVSKIGYYLRRYKLDELPQLINIVRGEMSIVGPRPEVPGYVARYNDRQRKVLQVRPGLTDPASLEYINESEMLEKAENPELFYLETIMPHKLQLNHTYIETQSFIGDIKLILKTLRQVF